MDRVALWARIEESATQELVGYISLVGGVDKSKDVESLEDYIDTWQISFWDKALTPSYLVLMHTINPLCQIKSRMGIFL